MAIPLVYNSCLSVEAVDAAIEDWAEVSKQIEAQDKEKAEWEAEQQQLREDAEKAQQEFEPEPREWEELAIKPFATTEQSFVVCIDTLGQDRELTNDQKRFALETVSKFKDTWEQFENTKLLADRDMRMQIVEEDKEWAGENLEKLQKEEETYIDEKLNQYDEFDDDDHKTLLGNRVHLEF